MATENPEPSVSKILSSRSINRSAIGLMIGVTVLFFVSGFYQPQFTTDSWSYLDLANSVFDDFFHTNTVRQFEFHSPYSNSFPPIWPVLIALVNKVFHLGIYGGYALNFVICLGTLGALVRLAQRLQMPAVAGALCYGCLITFPRFLDEALAARSIPLSLLLLLLTFFPLIRVQFGPRHAALAGFLMGLGCLVRFDLALAALMLGVYLAGRAWWAGDKSTALILSCSFFVAMVVVLSPWMFYCQTHFDALLASDNTRQLHVASRGHVMNYYEHPPASDLKQHPINWIVGFVTKKSPIVFNQLLSGIIGSCLPWLVGIVLFLWKGGSIKSITEKSVFARVSLPLIPWLVIPPFLVGYARERYFIPAFMILAIVLVCLIHTLQPEFWARRRAVLLLLIVVLFPAYNEGLRPLFSVNLRDFKGALAPLTPTEPMNKLTQAVSQDSGSNPHFVLQVDNNDNTKYGALTGEPTIALPTIVEGSFASFVRDWQVTHAYDPDDRLVKKLHEIGSEGVELIPLEMPGLYRLKRTEKTQ